MHLLHLGSQCPERICKIDVSNNTRNKKAASAKRKSLIKEWSKKMNHKFLFWFWYPERRLSLTFIRLQFALARFIWGRKTFKVTFWNFVRLQEKNEWDEVLCLKSKRDRNKIDRAMILAFKLDDLIKLLTLTNQFILCCTYSRSNH